MKKSIFASALSKQTNCDNSDKTFSKLPWPWSAAITLRLEKPLTDKMLLALVFLCTPIPLLAVETRYVTDEFEITMRSGTNTTNSIVRMLRSGQALTLLEEDNVSKYSLVETEGGKQGYVLTRFLLEEPAARQTLMELEERFGQQRQLLDEQTTEMASLKQKLGQKQNDTGILKSALKTTEQELEKIRATARDSLNIQSHNEQLQTMVDQLRVEKKQLTGTNSELSDSTRLDWFVRGGAVSLIAFIFGIVVTRVRWKRHDSWGS